MWLTANVGPDTAPLDDVEFLINMRVRLDLKVMQQGLCQHRRRPKDDGAPGARCLAPLDAFGRHATRCMIGGARVTLHDNGCHIAHRACVEAGMRSQREVVVPELISPTRTEPRVDIDAWGHPGLPHLRLDFTAIDPDAQHWATHRAVPAGAAAHAEREKATTYGKPHRWCWGHRIGS